MWSKRKVQAFTLLEALVALLVLSGGILIFQGLTKLLHSELDYQAHQKQEEWLLFQQQLQVELDRSHVEMIAGVRSSKIWQEEDLIHVQISFEEGLEREYIYHVVPAIQKEKS